MTKSRNDTKQMTVLRKYFDKADRDKDGEISMNDWVEALERAKFPHTQEDVERLFRENDKDLDGKLSWEEFCGEPTKSEKAFCLMDVDKNGKVSKEVISFI